MTKASRFAVAAATMLACVPARSDAPLPACQTPGEPIQWAADFCMLKMQTDDEIAVSDCIEQNMKPTTADECAQKLRYKRAMCGLFLASGASEEAIEKCLLDQEFIGRTVKQGGVGGQE